MPVSAQVPTVQTANQTVGESFSCAGLRYDVLSQKVSGLLMQLSQACGLTPILGQGTSVELQAASYRGSLVDIISALNEQSSLHWARIGTKFYAEDAKKSGSATVELKTLTRPAFEQILRDMRVTLPDGQVDYDQGNNVVRIAGPTAFITDLERALSVVKPRSPAQVAGIRMIKFGVVSRAGD